MVNTRPVEVSTIFHTRFEGDTAPPSVNTAKMRVVKVRSMRAGKRRSSALMCQTLDAESGVSVSGSCSPISRSFYPSVQRASRLKV